MQTLAPEAALSQFQLVASHNANVYKKNKCRVGFPDFCRASPPLMDPERLRKTRTKLPSSLNVNGGFCIQEQKVGSKLRIIRAQAVTTGDAMCACGLCRRLLLKPTCVTRSNQWLVYHFSFIHYGVWPMSAQASPPGSTGYKCRWWWRYIRQAPKKVKLHVSQELQ